MVTLDSLDLQKISPEELGELLVEAKKAYYTTSRPIMDDHTYDTLEEILRQKNPHHRIFRKIGAPNFDTGWEKKKHSLPMTSQNKVTSFPDLIKYFQLNLRRVSSNVSADQADYVVQPKCDGLSLELIYQNGQIADAITRGNGRVGDSVLQNVVRMKNFTPKLRSKFSGSIRCEIVVTFQDFKKINQTSEEKYSNTRNAASGLSQRLDSKYSEFCTLLAVDLIPEPKTEFEKINLLQKLDIVSVETRLCSNLSEVKSAYQTLLRRRSAYPFDIDGLVIKINDLGLAQKLGLKDNRPKHQVAYKFPAAVNLTRLLSVDWQTGPLGTVTPVAKIDPIEISGAVITSVSLANHQLIRQLNLNLDDIVEISRRGDVIPHLERVVTKIRPGYLAAPKTCVSCHRPLIADHKFLKCPNRLCSSQSLGILRLFCQTLDIKNISDKTIEKLIAAGKVKLPGDFYDLAVSDFIDLQGLGQKSGTNIVNEIQAKKNLTLVETFDAAIIPNFSAKRIRQIVAAGFDTPQKIINLTLPDLLQIPGFKTTLATKIVAGLKLRRQIISSILSKIKIRNLRFVIRNLKLSGLSFAITGDLAQPRENIERLIVANGGQIMSSVSKNTSYLIADNPSGSGKYLTAQKLGVKIITESQFHRLLS